MSKNIFSFFLLNIIIFQSILGQNQNPSEISGEKTNPSTSSFEAMPGELVSEEEDPNKISPELKALRERSAQSDELWKNAEFVNYDKTFNSLYELSPAFSNNKYRQALAAYQAGMNMILKMRQNEELIRKDSEETTRLNEKWYWQVVDRKARVERKVRILQRKSKLQAVTYMTRAIQYSDEITNKNLRETPTFKKLLSSLYRNWVIHQFDLGNFGQCIPILELYLQINENEKDFTAHKYLAQCYSFQENLIAKSSLGNEEQILRLKYKKNTHQLRATELKYGKDSQEYKQVVNILNREDIISIQN